MLKVGLTGSIAVGKSFVSDVFRRLGCVVIDADQIARDVVRPGTPGLEAVVAAFGTDVLNEDGSLNRKALGGIIFGDPARRKDLEAILHPLIIREQEALAARYHEQYPEAIIIIDAALMIESGSYKRFNRVIVVTCRPEIQIERLIARDGCSREEALLRISSQMPQEEKVKFADFVIDTSDGFEYAAEQVRGVYNALQGFRTDNSQRL